jgi:hypothetical protein
MVFGFVMFAAAFPLLAWNEGAVITTTRSLDEGLKVVVPVDSDSVSSGNDGKLIHFIADVKKKEVLGDATYGVAVKGAKMRREVEMYQWVEQKHSRTIKDNAGGKRTETSYSYDKQWSGSHVNSNSFKNRDYNNPSNWPVESKSWQAKKVKAGAFTLSSGLVGQLSASDPVPLDETSLVNMDKLLGSPSRKMIGAGKKNKKNKKKKKKQKKAIKSQKAKKKPHLQWGPNEVGQWVSDQGEDYQEYEVKVCAAIQQFCCTCVYHSYPYRNCCV